MTNKDKLIERAAEEIERVRNSGESKQPRFIMSSSDAKKFFSSIYGMVKGAIFDEPAYTKETHGLPRLLRKNPIFWACCNRLYPSTRIAAGPS
jgi:hypothetical protein